MAENRQAGIPQSCQAFFLRCCLSCRLWALTFCFTYLLNTSYHCFFQTQKHRCCATYPTTAELPLCKAASVLCRAGSQELILKRSTMVDSSIIASPSSAKSREKKRDPEVYQIKKDNTWHFGHKAHMQVALANLARADSLCEAHRPRQKKAHQPSKRFPAAGRSEESGIA